MKFGLIVSKQHPPGVSMVDRFREHIDQVRVARDAGFDLIVMGQHFLSTPFQELQTLPALARLAAEAGTMRVGATVILLPLLNPVDVAEQVATLDVITGGRFIFGVGLGYRDVENAALGVDPRARVGRLEEGLEVIERLWGGEPVSYEGRHFQLRDVRISLRPLQQPRPPIWLAANADVGVKRAARRADAWLMNPHTTLPTLERQLALFHETRAALGRPRARAVPLIRECYVAPDAKTAFGEAQPFLEGKYVAYRAWEQDKALPSGESFTHDFATLAHDRFLIGDPARVREEIARCQERLGITDLIVRVQWPGMDPARVLRSIRLLGEEVLPRLV